MAVAVGDKAPDLTLKDQHGNDVTRSQVLAAACEAALAKLG